jgi:hypothetical protein
MGGYLKGPLRADDDKKGDTSGAERSGVGRRDRMAM